MLLMLATNYLRICNYADWFLNILNMPTNQNGCEVISSYITNKCEVT